MTTTDSSTTPITTTSASPAGSTDGISPFINPAGENEKHTHVSTAYKTPSNPPPPNLAKFSFTQELGKSAVGAVYKIGWNGGAQQGSFKHLAPVNGNQDQLTADIQAPASNPDDPWGKNQPVIGTATFTLAPGPWVVGQTPQLTFVVTSITTSGSGFRYAQGSTVVLEYSSAPSGAS